MRREQHFVKRRENLALTVEMRDLMHRRTRPFLDDIGLRTPITVLLQEVYLQGLNDAIDAMHHQQSKDSGHDMATD